MDIRQSEIKTFIVENFLFGSGGESLTPEASLLELGVIDSTGVLELVGFLEQNFDITVDEQELIPENLDSLKSIVAFVTQKQKSGPDTCPTDADEKLAESSSSFGGKVIAS